MVGPLGLLSHWATKLVVQWRQRRSGSGSEYITYRF